MKRLWFVLVLAGFAGAAAGTADDNVTIPKSRLEELERKERELNQLKGDAKKTQEENVRLKREAQEAAKAAAVPGGAEQRPAYVGPALATLAPLKDQDVVDAMDLAYYYRTDSAAAEQRFGGKKFILRGEIAGFDKSLVKRSYGILLKTPERDVRVICTFYPPDKFNAVYTADHGSQLMAYMGENRVPLAKVGQTVTLKAQCRGWRDSSVLLSASELKLAP